MASQFNKDIVDGVKELIISISGFEENTELFNHVEKYIVAQLKKADSLYFLNVKDVDKSIESMSEKFIFHGFSPQAKGLKKAYNSYITKDLAKSELMNRLNIVQFLLCLSDSPTNNFWKNPEEFLKEPEVEEEIDWKEYLKEGIERWSPDFDEISDYSDPSSTLDVVDQSQALFVTSSEKSPVVITDATSDVIVDFRANREELLATVQHSWYNKPYVHMAPESDWKEANIGILWEKYLKDEVNGLISFTPVSIISEYKVMREVLWQLWAPHVSTTFEFDGDKLKTKQNVTISSVRSLTFKLFLCEFIPHIETLDTFREFSNRLRINNDLNMLDVPQTYRSYERSLSNILRPVYVKLSELEDKIRAQETTMTLIKLSAELKSILKPVYILKEIHDMVVVDFNSHNPLFCATDLLVKLHNSLQFSTNKMEQDIKLTLFLESLYYYFTVVDSWLMKDDFVDYTNEFVIHTTEESNDAKLNFDQRIDIDEFSLSNGIIKIMMEQVLEIGRNIHLLRLLGKYDLISEYNETIHEEFVRKTLEQLCIFFNYTKDEMEKIEEDNISTETRFKYPVICTDICKKPTEMDNLENLVDTSDGFLMNAFEKYFIVKPPVKVKEKPTLYEKISKITKTFFPIKCFFENIFTDILKERFTISGLMLKNVLIEEYKLDKQYEFLRHMFLFFDDLIFPFYRRFFEKLSSQKENWSSNVWLTSHLQDIIMDAYPDFYEYCSVQVSEHWRQYICSSDPCSIINLNYELKWPLNIIIKPNHMNLYKEIFRLILKIKWMLYTLHRLSFTDLEPKSRQTKSAHKTLPKMIIMRLKYLKFSLVNIVNSIQHFIFGFVFNKCLMKFDLDFEKSSDLTSIIRAHSQFIYSIYDRVKDVRDCVQDAEAFGNLMKCSRMLKYMWMDNKYVTQDNLEKCHSLYKNSYAALNPILNPVFIFDY